MGNKTKIILAIVIILIVSVAGVGTWMIVDNQKKSNENISKSESKITEQEKSDADKSIKEEKTTNNNEETNNTTVSNDSTPKSLIGTYSNKSETNDYYHVASLVITNQTNSSIDFKLSAVHGSDVDHVNTGEVSGKATIINIPQDSVIPESTQYAYQFVDDVDGKTCKITFVYTAHRMFEYVSIIEDYPDGINPYAGNRVYFEGEYEKIS